MNDVSLGNSPVRERRPVHGKDPRTRLGWRDPRTHAAHHVEPPPLLLPNRTKTEKSGRLDKLVKGDTDTNEIHHNEHLINLLCSLTFLLAHTTRRSQSRSPGPSPVQPRGPRTSKERASGVSSSCPSRGRSCPRRSRCRLDRTHPIPRTGPPTRPSECPTRIPLSRWPVRGDPGGGQVETIVPRVTHAALV